MQAGFEINPAEILGGKKKFFLPLSSLCKKLWYSWILGNRAQRDSYLIFEIIYRGSLRYMKTVLSIPDWTSLGPYLYFPLSGVVLPGIILDETLFTEIIFQKLDYRWVETASIEIGHHVKVLSWNISGTRLLVGSEESLELWTFVGNSDSLPDGQGVKFTMGADEEEPSAPWIQSWKTKWVANIFLLFFF